MTIENTQVKLYRNNTELTGKCKWVLAWVLFTLNSRCECLMRKATPLFSFSMFSCRSLAVTSKTKQAKRHQMKNYYSQSCKAEKRCICVPYIFRPDDVRSKHCG